MKNIIYINIIACLLLFGCKNKTQNNFSFEIEDSDEIHIMDNWNKEKKDFYFNKAEELQLKDLISGGYIAPDRARYSSRISELKINCFKDEIFQEIPFHIFELDSLSGEVPKLILFNKGMFVSFRSELPLISKSSLKYYASNDYINLDKSNSPNLILNTIIFGNNKSKIKFDNNYEEIERYLFSSFHYSSNNESFFKTVNELIKEYKTSSSQNLNLLMQLLCYRNKIDIDKKFLEKISKIDKEKILLPFFLESIKANSNILNEKTDYFFKEVYDSYMSNSNQKFNIATTLKNDIDIDFEIVDSLFINNNKKLIYLTMSKSELTDSQLLVYEKINQNYHRKFKLLLPIYSRQNYKKMFLEGPLLTFEYNCDSEGRYNFAEQLTILISNDYVLLNKYEVETYDSELDKNLQRKIWTTKDFGEIKFENMSEDFLIKLRNSIVK